MKVFNSLLTGAILFLTQQVHAGSFYRVGGSTPIVQFTFYQTEQEASEKTGRIEGLIGVDGNRIYAFNAQVSRATGQYVGFGQIRMEYRRFQGGPILLTCHYPLHLTLGPRNQPRSLMAWTANQIPTQIDVRFGCPDEAKYTRLAVQWGPGYFEYR